MIGATLLGLCIAATTPQTAPPALFALVIGANKSVDTELEELRFADDDAARYFDLFRSLRARSYLLTRLDDNTARLHPQAAAEAFLPNADSLQEVLGRLVSDVAQARERGVRTVLYVAYAGHGNMSNDQGYITLEDQRLSGQDLDALIVRKIGADSVHFIIDACYSYFLAHARGPGGKRRAVKGFGQGFGMAQQPEVGLLLSTSAHLESHEWEDVQAGVFSHEVRSGLYGAADADLDGQVTYREIAAFVEQANTAVPNERYRPKVFAKPPASGEVLVDLRPVLERSLEINGIYGHQQIEDARGIRLVEFNNAVGQNVHLLRPAGVDLLYLKRVDDALEYTVPPAHGIIRVASLHAQKSSAQARGGADNALQLLFSQPFDVDSVRRYAAATAQPTPPHPAAPAKVPDWLLPTGIVGASISGVLLSAAVGSNIYAYVIQQQAQHSSQREVVALNQNISLANTGALVLYAGAGLVALASGTALGIVVWSAQE